MGTKHPHYDVIVAWAAGEEIEFWSDVSEAWETLSTIYVPPAFYEDYKYRIKPKRIKKEGWITIAPTSNPDFRASFGVYATKEQAECSAEAYGKKGTICIRIEWEEEV